MEKDMKNIEKQQEKPLICIIEVNENIRRVETGQPLTRSLKNLNQFCEFRKKYEERDMIIHNTSKEKERKERERIYRQKPEVKKRERESQRKYNQRPEIKKKYREYSQRPEIKKRKREYLRKKFNIPKSKWRVK